MSQKKKQPKKVVVAKAESTPKVKQITANRGSGNMLFGKMNYMLMGIGILVILVGFMLMMGGSPGKIDPTDANSYVNEFNVNNELYSFTRTGLSVIIILIGFGIEFFAIMRRPDTAKVEA